MRSAGISAEDATLGGIQVSTCPTSRNREAVGGRDAVRQHACHRTAPRPGCRWRVPWTARFRRPPPKPFEMIGWVGTCRVTPAAPAPQPTINWLTAITSAQPGGTSTCDKPRASLMTSRLLRPVQFTSSSESACDNYCASAQPVRSGLARVIRGGMFMHAMSCSTTTLRAGHPGPVAAPGAGGSLAR